MRQSQREARRDAQGVAGCTSRRALRGHAGLRDLRLRSRSVRPGGAALRDSENLIPRILTRVERLTPRCYSAYWLHPGAQRRAAEVIPGSDVHPLREKWEAPDPDGPGADGVAVGTSRTGGARRRRPLRRYRSLVVVYGPTSVTSLAMAASSLPFRPALTAPETYSPWLPATGAGAAAGTLRKPPTTL